MTPWGLPHGEFRAKSMASFQQHDVPSFRIEEGCTPPVGSTFRVRVEVTLQTGVPEYRPLEEARRDRDEFLRRIFVRLVWHRRMFTIVRVEEYIHDFCRRVTDISRKDPRGENVVMLQHRRGFEGYDGAPAERGARERSNLAPVPTFVVLAWDRGGCYKSRT